MGELDGRVAIVTGAARGLGAAIVEVMVREGATVVAADVRADEATALASRFDRVMFIQHDVTDEASWSSVVGETLDAHGRVDVLVNNAGVVGFHPVIETTPSEYGRIMSVCATVPYLGIRSVLPPMLEAHSGVIVNIASVDGHHGMPGTAPYSAAKHAVLGLTQSVALEVARMGIRVMAVSPGMINTGMAADAMAGELGEIDVPAMIGCVAMDRIADPREVAEVVSFLASDRASYCTGTDIVVDGGWTSGLPLPARAEPPL